MFFNKRNKLSSHSVSAIHYQVLSCHPTACTTQEIDAGIGDIFYLT